MNIEIYNNAIDDIWIYLILNMAPLLIVGITLMIITLVGLFKRFIKKSIAFPLIIFCIIVLTYPAIEISIFNYDIQHENFDVYYGEFDYMQVSGNRKDVFDFSNKSNPHVRSVSDLGIRSGSYSGYILYGRTSRWVFAYSAIPFK